MSETKKEGKGTIIVNRGIRTYNLVNGPDGETRSLPPNGSIETLDAKEAKHLLRYHDLADISQASPQTAARIESHKREIERLTAENASLKEQHAKHSSRGASKEELNEETAGTGFKGPNFPPSPVAGETDPDTEPTHQETSTSEEAQEAAERSSKGARNTKTTKSRKR